MAAVPSANNQMKDAKVLNTHKTTEFILDVTPPDADIREGEWVRRGAGGWVRATGTSGKAFLVYGKLREHMRQTRMPNVSAIGANLGCIPVYISGAFPLIVDSRVYDSDAEWAVGDTAYIGAIGATGCSGFHKTAESGVAAGIVDRVPTDNNGMLRVLVTF